MSRKRYLVLCVLVLTGAFAGGYAANLTVPVAHAQDRIVPGIVPNNIRATGFTLVNPQGKVQAALRTGAFGGELILSDANGNSRVEIGASGGIVIRDANGRLIWRSPRGMGILPATE